MTFGARRLAKVKRIRFGVAQSLLSVNVTGLADDREEDLAGVAVIRWKDAGRMLGT